MPNKGLTHPYLHSQYGRLLAGVSGLLVQARRTAVRSVNAVLTSLYWQIGRRSSAKNDAVVHYAMGRIKAKAFASRYLTALPDPETLRQEIVTTQRAIEARRQLE